MMWLLENFEWMILLVGAAVIAWVFFTHRSQARMQRQADAGNDHGVTKP
ncbi:MAG: hypothetical protein PHY45_02120 [Rhodocyclaceae bacterium]|nr:hypothetical protein [Rhodocyclaceae bacterium]